MLKENYNLIEKSIHYLILNNKYVSELLYDLEKFFFLDKNDISLEKHLFISGLARSGSTLLLNILHQNNNYCSFTYKDMPMILAPNIWSKFTKNTKKNLDLKNRAHQDLVKININSPESFDEIFWKLIKKNSYITSKNLIKDSYKKSDIEEYCNLISLICKKNLKKNYLSKNNNSILRLEELLDYFKNSFFLIPYRDPLNHSHSLMRQHSKFTELQKNNKFIRIYMDWLGHHEFGLGHKIFKLNYQNNIINFKTNSINYWLQIWIDYYNYILDIKSNSKFKSRIIFFNYDSMCLYKNDYLNSIFKKIELNKIQNNIQILETKNCVNVDSDMKLIKKANEIYSGLLN